MRLLKVTMLKCTGKLSYDYITVELNRECESSPWDHFPGQVAHCGGTGRLLSWSSERKSARIKVPWLPSMTLLHLVLSIMSYISSANWVNCIMIWGRKRGWRYSAHRILRPAGETRDNISVRPNIDMQPCRVIRSGSLDNFQRVTIRRH